MDGAGNIIPNYLFRILPALSPLPQLLQCHYIVVLSVRCVIVSNPRLRTWQILDNSNFHILNYDISCSIVLIILMIDLFTCLLGYISLQFNVFYFEAFHLR